MSSLDRAERIDRFGKKYNEIGRYPCPKCQGEMIRMVDPVQSHIWYEQCGGCRGIFFDAGEFRDLKEQSIADLFKSWFAKERS